MVYAQPPKSSSASLREGRSLLRDCSTRKDAFLVVSSASVAIFEVGGILGMIFEELSTALFFAVLCAKVAEPAEVIEVAEPRRRVCGSD